MTDAERSRRYRKLAKKRRRARNFEWYTPRSLIELAVEVMGGIDWCRASCTLANQVVGAKVFFMIYTPTASGKRGMARFGSIRLMRQSAFSSPS